VNEYRAFVRALAATDDVAFAEYISNLVYPPHLEEMVGFLHEHPRALVLEPRGHAKTTVLTHAIARLIGERRGKVKVGILTEADGDAVKRSIAIRRMVMSPAFADVFPWARSGAAGEHWTEGEWTVAGAEGYVEKDSTLLASSLMGIKPGPRFDVLVLDDLIGPDEVTNRAMRERTLDRFGLVIEPMLVPGGTLWACGTKWDDDDLYAQFTRQFGWPVLLRKAIQDDGTALWPDYWSLERLLAKRTLIGSARFDLQYQNDPSGMGGNIFRRDWFNTVDRVPEGARRVGVDLAITANQRSDYTAAVEVLEDDEHNLYVVGAWSARLEEGHCGWLTGLDGAGTPILSGLASTGPRLSWPLDRLPAGFAGVTERYPAPRRFCSLNVESTAFQVTFTRELLRTTRLPAREVHPDRDKVTRARSLAVLYEQGKVYHLRGAPGIDELETELVAFPNGEHDDLVDAAVYAADVGGNEFTFGSSVSWF
jgi:predicted phage terminase large subunit-like protein